MNAHRPAANPALTQVVNDDLAVRLPAIDHATLLARCAELAYQFQLHDPQMDVECWDAVWAIADLLYPERTPACRQDGQAH